MDIKVFRQEDGTYRLATPKCVSCGFHMAAEIEEILDKKGFLCAPCKKYVVDSTIENMQKPRRKIAHQVYVYEPINDC